MLSTYTILSTCIPQGGFGRSLTSWECTKLRRHGVPCSPTYIVVRAVFDRPDCGLVYKPSPLGGFDSIGVRVTR